jgi:hypothetical protein
VKKLFKTALKINELAVNTATNAADWFFRKEILIQSGKTEYEVIAVPPQPALPKAKSRHLRIASTRCHWSWYPRWA